MEMRKDGIRKQDTRTYRRWYLGYGGEKEPDDTLINEDPIRKAVSTTSSENH